MNERIGKFNCPVCNVRLKADTRYCFNCFAKFDENQNLIKEGNKDIEQQSHLIKTVRCPSCGKRYQENMNNCPICKTLNPILKEQQDRLDKGDIIKKNSWILDNDFKRLAVCSDHNMRLEPTDDQEPVSISFNEKSDVEQAFQKGKINLRQKEIIYLYIQKIDSFPIKFIETTCPVCRRKTYLPSQYFEKIIQEEEKTYQITGLGDLFKLSLRLLTSSPGILTLMSIFIAINLFINIIAPNSLQYNTFSISTISLSFPSTASLGYYLIGFLSNENLLNYLFGSILFTITSAWFLVPAIHEVEFDHKAEAIDRQIIFFSNINDTINFAFLTFLTNVMLLVVFAPLIIFNNMIDNITGELSSDTDLLALGVVSVFWVLIFSILYLKIRFIPILYILGRGKYSKMELLLRSSSTFSRFRSQTFAIFSALMIFSVFGRVIFFPTGLTAVGIQLNVRVVGYAIVQAFVVLFTTIFLTYLAINNLQQDSNRKTISVSESILLTNSGN